MPKISIIIEAQNRAAAPLKQVQKQVQALGMNLKEFNRGLFATTAVVGTLMIGFRKAFETAKLGAQFGYIREQFEQTFGGEYLVTLRNASRGTVDAMTMMQQAMAAKIGGLDKDEIKNIFTLGTAIGKMQGKAPAQVITDLTTAFRAGRPEILASYFATLKFSNAFTNANKAISEVTKGWSAAGIKAGLLRKYGIQRLAKSMEQYLDVNDDALEIMMRAGSAFVSLKQVIGEFLARAMAPLIKTVGTYLWHAFDKIFTIVGATTGKLGKIRSGLIDLVKVVGGAAGAFVGLWGSLQVLTFGLGVMGVTLSGFVGGLMLASLGIMALKKETESWTQFLANLGTMLGAAWEAFKTWRDGTITISGDMYQRLKGMDQEWINRTMLLIKGAGLIKEAFKGVAEGFMFLYNGVVKVLRVFGLFTDHTKQMSDNWRVAARWIGRGVGMLGALYGLKLAKDVLTGGAGGLLSKIPVIGKLFGGGKRGESPTQPLYVMDVSGGLGGVGGILGGVGGKGGFLGSLLGRFKGGFGKGAGGVMSSGWFGKQGGVVGSVGDQIAASFRRAFPTFGRMAGGLSKVGGGILSGVGNVIGGAVGGMGKMVGAVVTAIIPFLPLILATLFAAGAWIWAIKRIIDAVNDPGKSGFTPDSELGAGSQASAQGRYIAKDVEWEGGKEARKAFLSLMSTDTYKQMSAHGMTDRVLRDHQFLLKEQLAVLKSIDQRKLDPIAAGKLQARIKELGR